MNRKNKNSNAERTQINCWVLKKTADKFQRYADDFSLSGAMADFLDNSANFSLKKIKEGDHIIISKDIIRLFINKINRTAIDEISEKIANLVYSEMKSELGKLTMKEVEERAISWNSGNKFSFEKIQNPTSVTFVCRHKLGKKWSEFQCKMYMELFKKLNQTVISYDYDDDLMFSIEINKY